MKKLFLLSFLVSLLFVSQSYSQWWVQGGNLLWPYGDVTIQNNLNVEGNINGIKKYVALLTQSGTNAPVAIVLENTIGDIVWTRELAGKYNATLSGAFPENKVFTTLQDLVWDGLTGNVLVRLSNDVVSLVINAGDDFIVPGSEAIIEIRVYP